DLFGGRRALVNASVHFHASHCHRGNTHAAPDRPELFMCCRFDAYIGFATVDGIRNFLPHRGNVRRDLRLFSDNSCINVEHAGFLLRKQFAHVFQNIDAVDAANCFVRVWEMLADIAGADRAQQCICDGVRQDVRIRMSFQSARVGNLDAAKNQLPSFNKSMHIVANSASNTHDKNDEIRMSNAEENSNDEYRSPLMTADITANKAGVALPFRASCLVISSSFMVTVSGRSGHWTQRCYTYLSCPRAGEDRQFHRHFQPEASRLRCPTG